MTDTTLHELCKGYGALLSRSKTPQFPEEASRCNDRGNLPLHAACSFQATRDAIDALLRAYPPGSSHANGVGNLPLHQAVMWQASLEVVEVLLLHYPEGASVRNNYGALPLHLAASNNAPSEIIKLLIDAYPDALHLQNDDGMTPLDLAMGGGTGKTGADKDGSGGASVGGGGAAATIAQPSDAVLAMLEGRPPPPELTLRQRAERYMERADDLERKALNLRGSGGRKGRDLKDAVAAVRRLADCYPQALYSAGIDPNELEIALSNAMAADLREANTTPSASRRGGGGGGGKDSNNPGDAARKQQMAVEGAILDAVRGRTKAGGGKVPSSSTPDLEDNVDKDQDELGGVRDRVEDLISSIVGLEHIKCQVRDWFFSTIERVCKGRRKIVSLVYSQI